MNTVHRYSSLLLLFLRDLIEACVVQTLKSWQIWLHIACLKKMPGTNITKTKTNSIGISKQNTPFP